jgi:SAM-dependent methyltransferase
MDEHIEKRYIDTAKSGTFKNLISLFQLDKKLVLDIGCLFGEFLVHFGSGSVGLTLEEEAVSYGKKRGLDIRKGDIEADNINISEKFDVIFANNLIEHLDSPHRFLLKTRSFLKPDGILILGVPSIPKVVNLARLKKFRGALARTHVNFFTKETINKTVERAGWEVIDTRGFHFKNKFIDKLLNLIYPHFYIVAKPNGDFIEKRSRDSYN